VDETRKTLDQKVESVDLPFALAFSPSALSAAIADGPMRLLCFAWLDSSGSMSSGPLRFTSASCVFTLAIIEQTDIHPVLDFHFQSMEVQRRLQHLNNTRSSHSNFNLVHHDNPNHRLQTNSQPSATPVSLHRYRCRLLQLEGQG
jgi:hypothetical protein